MSCVLFNNQRKVPNEILMEIFNHIDSSTLYAAAQVCRKWCKIAKLVHKKARRSLAKAVFNRTKILGRQFKEMCWVIQKHCWSSCKCVDIARDLIPYKNIKLLNKDLKFVDELATDFLDNKPKFLEPEDLNTYRVFDPLVRIGKVEEVEKFIRLAGAGILTSIGHVEIQRGLDLFNIKNLHIFFRIVETNFTVQSYESFRDFAPFLNYLNCKELVIESGKCFFTDEDIRSLTDVMNYRVELFERYGPGNLFPLIEKYDGRGKCNRIELIYHGNFDEEYYADNEIIFESESEKVHQWAISRGWAVEVEHITTYTLKRNSGNE